MALWGNHILRFPCCVQHCTYGLPLALEGKEGERGAGGDLVVVAPIHQWNLTLCPDGTKSGLQLMGTSPSSKGHLAGISHTPPHTHTYQIPDIHMQTGLVLGLLTLLYAVTWLSYSDCYSFTCFHVILPWCASPTFYSNIVKLQFYSWSIYWDDLLVCVLNE